MNELMNKFFAIGAYTYININFIEEIWTDQNKIVMHDGTTHVLNDRLFNELMEVIKPTMFGSECEFNYESKS